MPRALQTSHWYLDNELAQLQSFGFMVPAIFLGIAAFLLNVAMTRALAIQRPQIAALKALGYTNREIAETMNCAESTVERRLSRIRRKWSAGTQG